MAGAFLNYGIITLRMLTLSDLLLYVMQFNPSLVLVCP